MPHSLGNALQLLKKKKKGKRNTKLATGLQAKLLPCMAPVVTAHILTELKHTIIPVLRTMEAQPAGAQKEEWAFFPLHPQLL